MLYAKSTAAGHTRTPSTGSSTPPAFSPSMLWLNATASPATTSPAASATASTGTNSQRLPLQNVGGPPTGRDRRRSMWYTADTPDGDKFEISTPGGDPSSVSKQAFTSSQRFPTPLASGGRTTSSAAGP